MKRLIFLLLILCAYASCSEEDLSPSGLDKVPVRENPDMSKPLIAAYKNLYDVSIIYQFDIESDFKFAFNEVNDATAWDDLQIKQYGTDNIDYGLEMVDSVVLKYFKDEIDFQGEHYVADLKSTYFPKTIFLVDSLGGGYKSLGQYLGELNNAESEKSFTYIWNGYESMFAFNKKLLSSATETEMTRYRNSALYSFLSCMFIDKHALDGFPAEFFESVNDLYGKSVNDLAREEEAEVIKTGSKYYYSPEWYMSKGFGLTNKSPLQTSGVETKYTSVLDTTKVMNFPDRSRDFRNLLHVLICETKRENLEKYFNGPVITDRMNIMLRELYRRGIDMESINPVTVKYFTEQ